MSHPAVLIKRNRPWNLTGPLSWFIYQVYSAPEWWLCVMDTQGWVFAEHPPPPTLLHLILLLLLFAPSPWHQSSRLTPGFHRGGTTQASAPNEYRVGLLLLLAFARMWLTRPLNRGRLGFFFFFFLHSHKSPHPRSLCGSDVALSCTSYPYATAVCLARRELSVTLPKLHSKRLLETTHAIQQQQQQQKKPPSSTWYGAKRQTDTMKKKKTVKSMKNKGTSFRPPAVESPEKKSPFCYLFQNGCCW